MSIPDNKPISLRAKEIACQIEQYRLFIENLNFPQETNFLVAYLRQAHDKLLNVAGTEISQDQPLLNVTPPLIGELKQKIEVLQTDANASIVKNNESLTQNDVPENQDINCAVFHIQEAYKEFTRIKNFVMAWAMYF